MKKFGAVTKRYADGTVAVGRFSLEAPTGEITVFVGPSGCGKTTSLRMINRMIDATEGRILLDGSPVQGIDPPTLRRGIGYVIQQAGLFPHRRIVDNVATVPHLLGWSKQKARDRAAVLRVGGRLAQLADPKTLLSQPADDFVREFLGKDRGIRRLSFVSAAGLRLRTDLTVPEDFAGGSDEPWLLVVDRDRRPVGWISPRKPSERLSYGTYLYGRDSLRTALDAALLSPSGCAVAVDGAGAVVGVVTREALDEGMAAAAGGTDE